MKQNRYHAFAILIIISFAWWFQKPFINEPPAHIHAWAQVDRYAISLRFLDNGFDISKPETYVLNHQFPDDFNTPDKTSITSVDFPVTEYIVALLMKILDTRSPWVFRLFVLLYACVGAYFFYLLVWKTFALKENSKSWLSFTALLFLLTSPVYLYYQANFLPSGVGLSNAFIGLFFYKKYDETRQWKWYYWAYFFFALAALVRLPFIMLPFSLALSETYFAFKNRKAQYRKLFTVLLSFLLVATYYFYNKYLTRTYGSMFLNYLMPARSWEELMYIFRSVYDNWKEAYFTIWHYRFLLLLAIFFFLKYLKVRKGIFKEEERGWIHFIIYLSGCILYFFLMARQFVDHDYYFLDTFLIPVLLLFILIGNQLKGGIIMGVLSVIFVVNAFGFANDALKNRRTNSWSDDIGITSANFENAGKLLDDLKVPKDAKIMVLGSYGTNVPFVKMNRKGYVIMKLKPENKAKILEWDYDYLVIQRIFYYKDIQSNYPDLYPYFEPVGGDRNLIVCKKKNIQGTSKQTLSDFLKNQDEKLLWKDSIDFESPIVSRFWGNTKVDSTTKRNGKYAGYTSPDEEYGIGYFIPVNLVKKRDKLTLKLTGYFYKPLSENPQLQLVVQVSEKYYKSFLIDDLIKIAGKWTYSGAILPFPELGMTGEEELKIFILNPAHSELYYDDLAFEIYYNQ